MEGLDFSRHNGLVPVVAQDAATGEVLMLAYMNRQAFDETCQSGLAVYYSRSRGRLWLKGEQSGHVQRVRSIHIDCDGDAILLKVEQRGAACHEGYRSCFFRKWTSDGLVTTAQRLIDPANVYGEPRHTGEENP